MTLLAANLSLLQRLLGIPPEAANKIEGAHLTFVTGWPFGIVLGFLGLAGLWFGAFYWRDGTRPSWWVKGPLLALRILAISALMMMFAQPALRLRQVDSLRPHVVLLVDNSDSMTRPDPKLPGALVLREAAGTGLTAAKLPGTSRLERANRLIAHTNLLAQLAPRYNVHLYSFATTPHVVPLPTDRKKLAAYVTHVAPDVQAGDSTQMGVALRRALEDLSGQPLAGALIVSDGGSNLGEDPITVAEATRQAKLPVSTVGIGDPTRTKDIALLSVLADDVVRVNNTVSVYAAITQRGYAGKRIEVSLLRNGAPMDRQTLRLGPDDQKQEVQFHYVPTQAGRFTYTVAVTGQPDEVTLANNRRSFVQTVITKKLKVLYVENEPRYEFRYLRNAILRDTSLDFSCLLLSSDDPNLGSPDSPPIHAFPRDEQSLFAYDIVVLGDVPRSAFSEGQLEALRRFVEDRGGSLLVIAGEQHMPQEYAGTPLEAVLPVEISALPTPILTEDPFSWQLTQEGKRSPMLQLEDDPAENARVWETLPGMYWAAGTQRAKPGATVLAVHPSRRNADGPYPLVATQPFGSGRCYADLVDSTYLWRKRVGDRYFYRYWGQVFRWLTPRELPGNSRFVQLNVDRSNYRLGERAMLSARLLNAFYRPIKAENVVATVKTEGGQTQRVTLQATPGSPGLYTAQYQPDRVGPYQVSLISPVNPQAKANAAFVVETLALERQKPELDETLLKRVAGAGGGKYYTPDQLALWAKSLPDNPLTVRSEQEVELWDSPLLLLLFVIPLGIEWFVRKRKGLL